LPVSAQTNDGFIEILPEQMPFKSPFGAGPSQAVLFGDPSKPGVYVVRNRFPPGAHSNPHFHTQDRHITVIKGVWWMGTGKDLDFHKAVPMTAGSYVLHPAGGVHWDGAGDEETIVQIRRSWPSRNGASRHSGRAHRILAEAAMIFNSGAHQ
jgi:quercetin dioxygenase-like cupin family protein